MDWIGPGWYRIVGQAGTKLADEGRRGCSGGCLCATHIGGLMQGTHPDLKGQTVTRRINFYEGSSSGSDDFDIQVTNCEDYFVYNLKNVGRCYLGYCTQQ